MPIQILSTPIVIASFHQVRNGLLVSATKCITVSLSHVVWDIWMTVFIAVINVGATMILDILSRSFDPIVKATALNVVEFSGWGIPIPSISILTECGGGWTSG